MTLRAQRRRARVWQTGLGAWCLLLAESPLFMLHDRHILVCAFNFFQARVLHQAERGRCLEGRYDFQRIYEQHIHLFLRGRQCEC